MRKSPERPLRIAAVTGRFPIVSHTFVYQELLSMHEMLGAEIRLFHRCDSEGQMLHRRFHYFEGRAVKVESERHEHVSDFEYFRAKHPTRTADVLANISDHTGIAVQDLGSHWTVLCAFRFARLAESWGADYVHSYFFYDASLYAFVASQLLQLPRGVSTYADHMLDDWNMKVVPLHLASADVVVATSARARDELVGIGGPAVSPKIVVKPNGVDGRAFPTTVRAPVPDRAFTLLCVARLDPKKGLLDLLDSLRRLIDADHDVLVHLVGGIDFESPATRDYADAVAARIDELGLAPFVRQHGSVPQEWLPDLFANADAFIAPFVETETGDKDGIPTAVLEALAAGLPVIATDAGAIPEAVDDGIEGVLVPQHDPAALALAAQRLIEDPELRRAMGARARARFERDFDVRVTEPRLHRRILEVTAEGR